MTTQITTAVALEARISGPASPRESPPPPPPRPPLRMLAEKVKIVREAPGDYCVRYKALAALMVHLDSRLTDSTWCSMLFSA